MANGIGNQNVRRFPWMTPAGGAIGPAGVTADELKVQQGKTEGSPELRPIAQRGPVEFIAPTSSSDSLRLAVPAAANPFASPTGPRHDHMMVRTALSRSRSDISRAIMGALKGDPPGIQKDAAGQMRASLAREHAMLGLLQNLQEMQEHIYGQIIGNQEA